MFCLTLKDTPKRKEYALQHFKENKLDVEFFEGINGEKFGLRTSIPFTEYEGGEELFIKQGRIGCLLSHYMLWKTLLYLPYEEIIIFEDDVVLEENFIEKFHEYKAQLPTDWDYVFLGHCCLPPEEYNIKISNNIISGSISPLCTHAYMIKKSSLETLLDTNHKAWMAVDIQIQKLTLKILKHYTFIPPIANQVSLMRQKNPEQFEIDDTTFDSLTLDSKYK